MEQHPEASVSAIPAASAPPPPRGPKRSRPIEEPRPDPAAGVYYWIWLAPEWRLIAFPRTMWPEVATHADAWAICARKMAARYGLNDRERAELEGIPRALPRGRVALSPPGFRVHHGGDAPVAGWRAAVLRAFGLRWSGGATASAAFVPDERRAVHEDDRARLHRLGIVPPDARPERRGPGAG